MQEQITLTYRHGVIADKEGLKQLGILAYQEFAGLLQPRDWDTMYGYLQSDEKLLALIQQATTFVCADGDKVVGMAFLVPSGNPTAIYPADWCYIRMVGVHPAYRGYGIAKTLVANCIGHAREKGEQTIALHTSALMDAARHVYEKIGFAVLKEIEPLFGMRYWLYTMSLA